jgi:hypothetical protein
MPSWVPPFLAGLLVAALVAVSATAVVQTRRLADERERVDALTAEVAALRADVEDLEARLAASPPADADPLPGLEELLGGLLGGDAGGLLGGDGGGLLDGLLGGDDEPVGGLLGLADTPGARCLLPGPDGPSGLLDGLLQGLGGRGSPPSGDPDPDTLVRTIADQVAELRELTWQEEVEVAFLDDQATLARLEELLADEETIDRDRLELEQRLLVTLGAVPAGTDLFQVQRTLLEDSVAGFYVSDTGELVVRVPDDGRIRGIDRITLAHELQHALADQTLGLPDRREAPLRDDADADLAALALVEGDATLTMQLWGLEHVPLPDQLAALGDPDLRAAQAALEAAPHHLQRALLAPYTDGLDWVCDRWLDGGWAAIDAAYASPPATSAEVLFGTPVDPVTTATLGSPRGFREVGTTTFGAAPLLWLFEAPGGDPARALDDPRARAEAWGGGEVRVWSRGEASAVGLALVDRAATGARPLCASVGDLYAAAWPDARELAAEAGRVWRHPDGVAVLRCDGDDVVLGVAPDLTAATTIAAG